MEIVVNENDGIRIDKYLMDKEDISRSKIKKLVDSGNILVNENNVKASYSVKLGDVISILEEDDNYSNVIPEDIPLDIVYEDKYLMVINKPSGMVVHPANGNYNHTLVNALMFYSKNLSKVNGDFRPGIVHRIDKDTSGLLLIAKDDNTHNALAKQISEKTASRKYVCLVHGIILESTAEIDAPIGRDKNDRKKMCVTGENSKDAITYLRVISRYKNSTLVECSLKTGRTHQIRVHMDYIGHPIVNDPVYGYNKMDDKEFGQMLHAKEISFIHPVTNEKMCFKVDPPKEFDVILNKYREM